MVGGLQGRPANLSATAGAGFVVDSDRHAGQLGQHACPGPLVWCIKGRVVQRSYGCKRVLKEACAHLGVVLVHQGCRHGCGLRACTHVGVASMYTSGPAHALCRPDVNTSG
jgi:hypothetical protein